MSDTPDSNPDAEVPTRRTRRWRDSLPGPMASDMRSVRRRATVVGTVLWAGLAWMGWRATEIAVHQHEAYAAQGNRQQLRSYTLSASRGTIVDRNYVSLAVNDRVDRLVINPRLIHARHKVAEVREFLVTTFGEEWREHIVANLEPPVGEGERRQEVLKAYRLLRMHLTEEQAWEIRRTGLPGLRLEDHAQRVYPRGMLAAHVLGRVDSEGRGNLGIELGMNRDLRGREASSPAYFAGGKKLLVDGHPDHAISRGQNVVLTIDTAVQAMAEEEIDTLVSNWHPVGASIVVLEPGTGEILAMTNRPTFDPNHRIGSTSQTSNLAVQAAYEPGSTMKAITVAAALEQGTIRKNQTFFCENGKYEYTSEHFIRDTKRSEWLDVTQILALSSNIGTTKIYSTLTKRGMHRWVRRFHFGERPDVQLPGATKGLLSDWQDWPDIQGANISFGQGMSASPLQVAAAFSVLANGGVYNAPTVVRRIVDGEGDIVWEHEPERERVVRTATAATVLDMLTQVVHSKKGTGKKAKIEGYTVAGKTSTAQKADHKKGGYYEDQYYASFVGAVPADDPRVVILVSVDNPEGGHYGNEVAAPTFSRLGTRVMAYLGEARDDGSVPAPERITVDRAAPELVDGFIPDLDVEPSLPGRRPAPVTTGLPDFTGLTLAQAYDAAELASVDLRANGTGIAVGQDTAPGPVTSGSVVTVHFEPPG